MKKITYILMALCIAVSMVACSNNEDDTSSSSEISIAPTAVPTGDIVEAGRETTVEVVRVTANLVNVRSDASTDSTVLDRANTDDYFLLLEQGDVWNKIEYNGATAYISATYTTVEEIDSDLIDSVLTFVEADTSDDTSESDDGEEASADDGEAA